MDRQYYTYQLRIEGDELPFYIGKGKDQRAWEHLKTHSLRVNSYKNNTIKKAMREGKQVLVEILREGMTDKQSQRLEKYWIAKIGRFDLGLGPLTNGTDGGDGQSGAVRSDETRIKLSKAAMGHSRTKGIRKTEEHKANMRKPKSDSSKMSKPKTEEHRAKMLGNTNRVAYWNITDPEGIVTTIVNLSQFCRENDLDMYQMRDVSKGKIDNHNGYRCMRIPAPDNI